MYGEALVYIMLLTVATTRKVPHSAMQQLQIQASESSVCIIVLSIQWDWQRPVIMCVHFVRTTNYYCNVGAKKGVHTMLKMV